jgi:hypothetical protein
MKILKPFLLVIFSLILLSSNCKKDNQAPVSELSKLPAATQIGANTFGCLVNGVAFLPGGDTFSGAKVQCNYIYLNNSYSLNVSASFKGNNGSETGIFLQTDSLPVKEGQTLNLKNYAVPGMAFGSYDIFATPNFTYYETNSTVTGQLTITHFDQTKQIMSGTFSFNAVNTTNSSDAVKITDGRFDMLYTQ